MRIAKLPNVMSLRHLNTRGYTKDVPMRWAALFFFFFKR